MLAAALVPLLFLAAPAPACVPGCAAQGGVAGFVPPVLLVHSGATVAWSGLDSLAHENVEGPGVGGPASSCFTARFSGARAGSATFVLQAGHVVALQAGVGTPCASAVLLPGGAGALLPYHCRIHPSTMNGVLLLVP
jgi:plastocyanin